MASCVRNIRTKKILKLDQPSQICGKKWCFMPHSVVSLGYCEYFGCT